MRGNDGTYRDLGAVEVPRAGVSLGHDLFLSFAIAPVPSLLTLSMGRVVDPALLDALVGPVAADRVATGEDGFELPEPVPEASVLAWQLAMVRVVRRAPVLRSTRPRWAAMVVVVADALDRLGFDCRSLVRGGLQQLPALLGPADQDLAGVVGSDPLLLAAVRTGWQVLDPFDEQWLWFDAVNWAIDGAGCRAGPPGSVAAAGDGKRTTAPRKRQVSGPAAGRRFPLVWDLIDEAFLPEDGGFDDAVELVAEHDQGLIRVACRPDGVPALYARLVTGDGQLRGVTALAAAGDCWEGVVPLPEGFALDEHRLEIVDDLARPVRPASGNARCRQWAVLAAAQDLGGGDGSEAWSRSVDAGAAQVPLGERSW